MDMTRNYVADSLELHLFFARIMKEHAFFLKVGFLPPNADLAREGEQLLRQFERLLSRAISLSNNVVCESVLTSGEVFTEFTDKAEQQTQHLTGTFINRELTARAKQLRGRGCGDTGVVSNALTTQVRQLNRDTIVQLNRIIDYKERILCGIECCKLFTVNYHLLVEHILREARLYRGYLICLERDGDSGRGNVDSEFWNQIMMEHALFIRGLLDPSEDELINTADGFAEDYKKLLEAVDKRAMCCEKALKLTQRFRDFKQAGVEGIEKCSIKSIILPLLADHVLREANHYLRMLEDCNADRM